MNVILNNTMVNVIITRKKIKNIYMRFDEDNNLCVSVNRWTHDKEILELLNKNKKSLERMLQKVQKKQEKNNEFWYLGNKYELVFDPNVTDIEFQDGKLKLKNQDMLDSFLKRKTREIFIDEVKNLKNIIDTPPFTLKFRKMKTRWGVCNYKLCTITLNTELIRYKRENIRYVIVHEMCHFYHHDHSKNFWNMVEYYYPNYKQARKELRD